MQTSKKVYTADNYAIYRTEAENEDESFVNIVIESEYVGFEETAKGVVIHTEDGMFRFGVGAEPKPEVEETEQPESEETETD